MHRRNYIINPASISTQNLWTFCREPFVVHHWMDCRTDLLRKCFPTPHPFPARLPKDQMRSLMSKTMATITRVQPKLGFGYGFGAETAKFLGFCSVSVRNHQFI